MMSYPPIDDLVSKTGSKYALVSVITKRARILLDKRAVLIEDSGIKAISYAAAELFNGKIVAVEE